MMAKPKTDVPDDLKPDILEAALVHAPFTGWSEQLLSDAEKDLGLAPGLAKLAFPKGATDLLDYWGQASDDAMARAAEAADLGAMRLNERIAFLVKTRIQLVGENREAAKTAMAFLMVPMYHGQVLSMTARTVDRMWKLAGDTSTDFNYYTKRISLSTLYSATFMYFLSDESENNADTWEFLDRRIADLLSFEKTKVKVKTAFENIPSIASLLGEWRYGPTPKDSTDNTDKAS